MNMIIKCEVFHLKTNKIFSYHEQILVESPVYNHFLESDDPTVLGFVYERDYVEPQDPEQSEPSTDENNQENSN